MYIIFDISVEIVEILPGSKLFLHTFFTKEESYNKGGSDENRTLMIDDYLWFCRRKKERGLESWTASARENQNHLLKM